MSMDQTQGDYAYAAQERVVWGKAAVDELYDEVIKRKARRTLIVTSPTLVRVCDAPEKLRAKLGEKCVGLFDALEPHSPAHCVKALYDELVQENVDLIISFGGGTPIDTAKIAIAMIAADLKDPLELVGQNDLWLGAPKLRQIACPTTLSGAEFSDLAGLTDIATSTKYTVQGFGIGPAMVVLDPELSIHTPLDLWVSTGIRAIDHAVEALCSIAPTPFTDSLARDALRSLPTALRNSIADPESKEARLEAHLAVWMAGVSISRTPYGASHGIGHQLGSVAGVPHGICSCVLLPSVLQWNLEQTKDRQAEIAKLLDAPSAAEGVRKLVTDLGLPTCLSAVGVRRDQFRLIADCSMDNRFVQANPRPIRTTDEIIEILEMAY